MKKGKKAFISLLTCGSIVLSFVGCEIAKKGFVSFYYRVNHRAEITLEDDSFDSGDTYCAFREMLIDEDISNSPIDSMVPQGITVVDDLIITSCYDATAISNSALVTLDHNSEVKNICYLDNKAHVGGIAYDRKRELVWVAGNDGEVNAYSVNDVLDERQIEPKYAHIDIGDGLRNYRYPWLNSVASMALEDDFLYVGSFSTGDSGLVKRYKIQENEIQNKISLDFDYSFKIPSYVQGFSFYRDNGKEYIIFSRSYGKYMSSIIQVFLYSEEIKDYTADDIKYVYCKAPSMVEQIVSYDDRLYTTYESAALKFKGGLEETDEIYILDLPKLIKKLY